MKLIGFLCLFFIFNNCFAQTKSGEVVYYIQRKNVEANDNDIYDKYRQKILESTTDLEFQLIFNEGFSNFSLKENLESDANSYFFKMAMLATRGNSSFKYSNNKNILFERTEFGGEIYLIESTSNQFKWNLENIQKEIAGFICYKATAKISSVDHSGKRIDQFYTAWYTPEIPFNYGPFELNGLPGLVLEFSDNTKSFIARNVHLSDDIIDLKPFTEGIKITKKDFKEILKNTFNKFNN